MINCDSDHALYETTGGRLNCEVGLVEVHHVYIQVLWFCIPHSQTERNLLVTRSLPCYATIKTHSIDLSETIPVHWKVRQVVLSNEHQPAVTILIVYHSDD